MTETQPDQRYLPQLRLRHQHEFQTVYQAKCSAADRTLIVYAVPNQREYSRLGLSVSRRVGNAVCRNRWKRRIREAFRTHLHQLPTGFDFVVIPRRGAVPTWDLIRAGVLGVFPRAAKQASQT